VSRIHSGRRGRSGSHRPYPWQKPGWVTADPKEVSEEAVKLAKGGMGPAQVGAVLRDGMAVPSIRLVTGRRMIEVLSQGGVQPDLPDDLQALLKRVVHLQRHLALHPKDLSNSRGLSLMEARIRRLAHYYRAHKRLPENWRYTSASAVLQVE
jgi:small subunit ribosomal protein S15